MKLNKYIANEIRDNKKLYSQKELAKKYEEDIADGLSSLASGR